MNTINLKNNIIQQDRIYATSRLLTSIRHVKKPTYYGIILGVIILLAIQMMAAANPYKCVTVTVSGSTSCKEYQCTTATCPPGSWKLIKTVPGTCPAKCPF